MQEHFTQENKLKEIISRLQDENIEIREENKILREENKNIKKENGFLRSQLEDVMVQLENLKEIIFGKNKEKNKKEKNDEDDEDTDIKGKGSGDNGTRKPRDNKSYRRQTPDESEITDTETHKIDNCPHCHEVIATLTKK